MGTLRAAVVALAIGSACGPSSQRPGKPGLADPARKTYVPLGIREDAKRPNQAVILGTDDKNGSTVVALPAVASQARVDAMVVRLGGRGGAVGETTPVKLATAPNSDGSVQVGVFEELSGGAGSQWRAGVWVSAFVAANALGKDLTDFTFTASSGGHLDGASASGLMAGGFLAAMTGAAIDPRATMTGIINPDGTIGPVSGIPEKFKASLAAGKKRLGFPIGMRLARSEATGQLVDLVQLAKAGGGEAVEVTNVHDAYALLTGKQLPQPLPVPEADMAVDDATQRALDSKYRDWQRRLADEYSSLIQLQQAGRLPPSLLALGRYAQGRAEQAERLHDQRLYAAAYARMLEAWIATASATDTYDILQKVQAGNLPAALAALAKLAALADGTSDVFRKIGAIRPATLGGHLLMLGSFQSALRGWGFRMFAGEAVRTARAYLTGLAGRSRDQLGSAALAEQLVGKVAPTVVLIGRMYASSVLAAQRLEFETEQSINYTCSIANVRRLATSFQSASAAGIQYFDTLLVEPLAKSAGIAADVARSRVMMMEPQYLVAFQLSRLAVDDGLPRELKELWGEGSVAWNMMALAANELAYQSAAELVAKHYSLQVHDGPDGRAAQVEHDKAFANMLASADRVARSSARAARIATGAIPVQARLAYQLARVQRDGDLEDKLEALSGFWSSSAFSQAAVMLARN
jgi:uncharacterized protein